MALLLILYEVHDITSRSLFSPPLSREPWILQYFQAFYLVFFAFTMLSVNLILGAQKSRPSYTSYLGSALTGYIVVAFLLMLSTLPRLNVGANLYFLFTLAMVVITAVANGKSWVQQEFHKNPK
jgi:hypothetical protein